LQADQRLDTSACTGDKRVADKAAAFSWAKEWFCTLKLLLTSEEPDLRSQGSLVWLPATLRLIPASLPILLDALEPDSDRVSTVTDTACQLRPYIAVLTAAKSVGLVTSSELEAASDPGALVQTKPLLSALHHCDESLRLDALKFVCTSGQGAAPVSTLEVLLFREALPLLMASSNTAIRNELATHSRTLLLRLRQAWASELGHTQRADQRVLKQLDKADGPLPEAQADLDAHTRALERNAASFLGAARWLHDLCLACLGPAMNFQRRFLALQILKELLAVVFEGSGSDHKRGGAAADGAAADDPEALPAPFRRLFARDWRDLYRILSDPQERVRSVALWLLRQPQVAPPSWAARRLWTTGLGLCSRFRVKDADCGADYVTAGAVGLMQWGVTSGLSLCQELMAQVKEQMANAKRNILKAAGTTPVHGLVLALRRLLEESGPSASEAISLTNPPSSTKGKASERVALTPEWVEFLAAALAVVEELVELGLSVLTLPPSSEASTRNMPSHAELEAHLMNMVGQCDPTASSEDCAVVYNFSWLILRNTAPLLARIVLAGVQVRGACQLQSTQLDTAECLFSRVLFTCRHRGVLEAFAGALADVSNHLAACKSSKLARLPEEWLSSHMKRLEDSANPDADDSVTALSVTRRSAGLPYVVLALLQHPQRAKVLRLCIPRLLALGAAPVDEAHDERVDPPQV
jgi:hypothetical protein